MTRSNIDVVDLPKCGGGLQAPYEFLDSLRARGPIHRIRLFGQEAWLVTRHKLIKQLLLDRNVVRASTIKGSSISADLLRSYAIPMLNSLAQSKAIEDSFAFQANALISTLRVNKGGDLLHDYALPLAGRSLCDALSVPQHEASSVLANVSALSPVAGHGSAQQKESINWLRSYFSNRLVVDEPRFCRAGLSNDEIVDAAVLLLAAGYEPTGQLIAGSLLTIMRNRETFTNLPAGIGKTTATELIRYDSPVFPGIYRYAKRPVMIAGRTIEKGDLILLPIAAAGRDPDYGSSANMVDPQRPQGLELLAFGHGPRFCVGAPLARLIHLVAVSAFIPHFREAHLTNEPEWSPFHVRALTALAVAFI